MKKNIITLVAILFALATQAQTDTIADSVNKQTQEIQTVFRVC